IMVPAILRSTLLAAPLAVVASLSAARADDRPSAMVESVSTPQPGLEEMGYVAPGARFDLPAGATLVLDYLQSCVHETITGGRVVIGTASSQVDGGHVQRGRADCDGSQLLQLAASASDVGGAAAWRGLPAGQGTSVPSDLTLMSTAPLVVSPQAGTLRIERLDVAAPPMDVPLVRSADGRRALADFARLHLTLAPGGLYRVSTGDKSRIVRIAPDAGGGDAPLVG